MLYFLISGFRISGSTKSIYFFRKLIGSSANQPPQPCCVDLNGISINCESRFDTSIPTRSIFWTWWLDQCISEQVKHRNRNVLIFLEILVWTQKQCPSPVFPSISMDLLQGFRFVAYTSKYHPALIPTLIRTRFQTSPENFFYSKNQYQRRSTCLKPVESGTGFLIDKLTRNLRNLILLCQRGSISLLETIWILYRHPTMKL